MSAGPSRVAAAPAIAVALAGLALAAWLPGYLSRPAPGPRGEPARRIVSLSPSTTEALFAMGLGERVIGVTTNCDYPPGAGKLPCMGGYGQPAIESILAARPDLVAGSGQGLDVLVREIPRAGVPVYIAPDGSLEAVASGFEELGRHAGEAEAGARLAADFRAAFENARRETAGLSDSERPKVYVEIWHDPLFAVGRDNFIDEMIEVAGGRNAIAELGRGYIRPTAEDVIRSDPDVIVTAYMTSREAPATRQFAARPGWGGVRAVREGRVWSDIDIDLLLRPGPRLADGLKRLAARLAAVRGFRPGRGGDKR